MPSSSWTVIAFFGPKPGIAVISRTPAGTWSRKDSSSSNVPVPRNSETFPAIDFPTPGIDITPRSSSVRRSSGYPPTARAAFS